MLSLGINIVSSNVKVTMMEEQNIIWSKVEPHEGNFLNTLQEIVFERKITAGNPALAAYTEGRHLFNQDYAIVS